MIRRAIDGDTDSRPFADDMLGPLGRRVMDVLWSRGASTAREVVEVINRDAPRPLAYTTVNTILFRLNQKGYARRVSAGRQFRYEAAHQPDEMADAAGRRDLEQLIGRYGAPAVARFAEDLAGQHPELLDRLRELAARRKRTEK